MQLYKINPTNSLLDLFVVAALSLALVVFLAIGSPPAGLADAHLVASIVIGECQV